MSSITFNSNILAQRLQRLLLESSARLGNSFSQLSSGSRINRSSDDAAGLAISSQLRSQSRVFGQGVRNVNDGISMLSIAGGALSELTGIVGRLRELAEQSANGTLARTQRVTLDTEANSLTDEFNRIVGSTKFNGRNLLDGLFGTARIQMGYGVEGGVALGLGNELDRAIGTAQFGTATASTAFGVSELLTGYFNRDGYIDTISETGAPSTLSTYFGDGTGGFTGGGSGISTGAFAAFGKAVGDINGDGVDDVVVQDSTEVDIYINDGNANFTLAQSISGSSQTALALIDMNGDGTLDLVSGGGTSVKVYQGNGNGTFNSSANANTIIGNTSKISAGDFNGDGIKDLAVKSSTTLNILLGSASGSFGSAQTFGNATTSQLSVGDYDHDGLSDVVYQSSGTVYLWKGSTGATLESNGTLTAAAGNKRIHLTDINNDGNLDIAAQGTSSTVLYYGSGSGSFSTAATLSTTGTDLNMGDINNDGVLDLIYYTSNNIQGRIATTQQVTTTQRFDLTSQSAARATLTLLDSLQARIQFELGSIGALQSRLEAGGNVLSDSITNTEAANSRISDVDTAFEASNLLREQIRQSVSAALLGQANLLPQLALSLLSAA